jgi:hypothetical protein
VAEPEQTVRERISAAFADTPSPAENEVVAAPPGADPEYDQVAAAFRGKRWQDLEPGQVLSFADSLPLFTPKALRYYLPAYMLVSVGPVTDSEVEREAVPGRKANPGFESLDVSNFVLFRLMVPESRDEREYFLSYASLFNTEERKAVARYLELMADRLAADWAAGDFRPRREEMERSIRFWDGDAGGESAIS